MDEALALAVLEFWEYLPLELRSPCATTEDLLAFEEQIGRKIPAGYRWFLQHCGGGPYGAEYIDGIEDLADSHHKFAEEAAQPRGWTLERFFLIGWDGAGNPYGIDETTGAVVVADHTFAGVHVLASSFEDLMRAQLKP